MGKTSDSFLKHAVSNTTQYTEGWRQICQELLDERAKNKELWEAVDALRDASFNSSDGAVWDRFDAAMDACHPLCDKRQEGTFDFSTCTLKRDHQGDCVW